ncbi:MAG: (2Fe-2S)-binding protein [Anaerolineae bacterium]
MKYPMTLRVNGDTHEVEVRPQWTLLEVLRDELDLTGTNDGCRTGNCGACTVLLDGRPITSCLMLALDAAGHQVTTIEALTTSGELHPLQRTFVERGAIQCGYCTPGMILSAYALLEENPQPTDTEVRYNLIGNLCRCTGYAKIVEAVLAAVEES